MSAREPGPPLSPGQTPRSVRSVAVGPYARESERLVDSTLADSFPASDPPSWTMGIEDIAPEAGMTRTANERDNRYRRRPIEGILSLLGGAATVLAVPIVLLAIGLPVVLAIRAVLEVFRWIFPGLQ